MSAATAVPNWYDVFNAAREKAGVTHDAVARAIGERTGFPPDECQSIARGERPAFMALSAPAGVALAEAVGLDVGDLIAAQ